MRHHGSAWHSRHVRECFHFKQCRCLKELLNARQEPIEAWHDTSANTSVGLQLEDSFEALKVARYTATATSTSTSPSARHVLEDDGFLLPLDNVFHAPSFMGGVSHCHRSPCLVLKGEVPLLDKLYNGLHISCVLWAQLGLVLLAAIFIAAAPQHIPRSVSKPLCPMSSFHVQNNIGPLFLA